MNYDKYKKINAEKILLISSITLFVILVVMQAALLNPIIRKYLNVQNNLDGEPLGIEECLYKEGKISLKLINGEENKNLIIILNGDEITVFTKNIMDITVKNGDVIEIDGSNLSDKTHVKIVSASIGVDKQCLGRQIAISSGVMKLAKIKIE